MQKLVKNYLDELNKRHKRNRRAAVALLLLAVLVIGGVLSTLSQYGVAMEEPEKKPLCGLEEHTHTEECYEDVLICGYGEEAEAAEEAKQEPAAQEPAVQEQVERVLSCGQDEQEGHQHSDSCYETKRELTCGQEESEEHTHTDECYTEESVLACGKEEGEGAHTHTEDCYTETVVMVPVETAAPAEQKSSEEAAEKHTHTDACYEHRLVCGLEEHTHTEACYIDGAADVETASDWEEMFADVEWKEQWGEDLVTAAQMQIGYQESKTNYQSDEDGAHKGYTRYGAFMDDPYMDWNAAFVNFCMHYAGLCEEDVFPEETNAGEWYKTFVEADENNANYITLPEEYEPKAGDIVFLEDEENEETLMGVVSSYDEETGEAKVIAGDDGDEVTEETYVIKGEAADESPISSYLMTTELEDHIKNNTRIMKAEGEDYTVTVRFTDAAEIPDDAELNVREIEEGTDEYQTYYERSLEAVGAEELSFARCFDVTFLVNGEKIEPKDTVNVTVSYKDSVEVDENSQLGVAHFKNDRETEILDVESNLNGDTAVTSEEKVGSGLEEETTGTFFRFNQNSFSGIMTFATSNSGDNAKASGTEYTFYKWSEIDASTELDGKIVLFTNSNKLMTGTLNDGAMKSSSCQSNAGTLSTVINNAWAFEKDDVGRYYLYNVGEKKYLKLTDEITMGQWWDETTQKYITEYKSKMDLVPEQGAASALTISIDNNRVIISLEIGDKTFRLNRSGNSEEGFVAYTEGSSYALDNEKFALFKLQKTVVLNPYNIVSDNEGQTTPYKFKVDNNTSPRRLSLNVDILKSNIESRTVDIYLPSNKTRSEGFDLSNLESKSHKIEDNGGYLRELKGWYNIADDSTNAYKSVVDGPEKVTISLDKNNVFYADWVAASYNNGTNRNDQITLGGVVETADTSGFVKTELFDYNELVNITLQNLGANSGKTLSTEGEKWEYDTGTSTILFGDWVLDKDTLGTSRPLSDAKINFTNRAFADPLDRSRAETIVKKLFDFEDDKVPMGITPLGTADGLFQYTDRGYEGEGQENYKGYYYDSTCNAASFNKGEQAFYVYENPQKIGGTAFLPFNNQGDEFAQNAATVNYWFGMKTQIDYWLDDESGSGLEANYIDDKPMIFEFTGDDDVWVFDETPDGERTLILNLSSCHSNWSGSINFSTGEVFEQGNKLNETFKFTKGAHRLTVYYLERGAGESNCAIRFNLTPCWNYEGKGMQKITVKKEWEDADGEKYEDGELPKEIENETVSMSLYKVGKDGKKTLDASEPLSKDDNWTYTWYRSIGETYTVEEDENPNSPYIMSDDQSVENPEKSSGAFWIENSNLSNGDRIVIGNGLSNNSGKVLQVNVSGEAASITQPKRDTGLEGSDVLRNDDEDVEGVVTDGIPLNQQWIVYDVQTSGATKYFKLKSALYNDYSLYIFDGNLELKNNKKDGASSFYFNQGNLTGTSKNRLVVNNNGEMEVLGDSTKGGVCVHLYKCEQIKEELVTTFTITNKPLTANLKIKKVDRTDSNKFLEGAEFDLYQIEESTGKRTLFSKEKITTSSEGGFANIGSLPVGIYHLEETTAPSGYALLTKPVVITVSKNINENPSEGEKKVSVRVDVDFQMGDAWANGNGTDSKTEGNLTYDATTKTFEIEVPNVLLYELPSTGGAGTYWYTIGGTLLLMAAALVLYKRKYAGR